MVAINGRELLRRAVGILHNRYNLCLTKLSLEGPTTLDPWNSGRPNPKKSSPEAAPVPKKETRPAAPPNGQTVKGRKQGRVKRKRYVQFAKDDSAIFMPGGFRKGPPERKTLQRSKLNPQGNCEPGGCDSENEDRCARRDNRGAANEHEAFVKKQIELLMFDKLKRESQFHVKEISERVKRQAPERKARLEKETVEAERLWKMQELERREEKERAERWKAQRLAQLEKEKRVAESELAREKLERKQSKLRRLFQEQQRRHKEEGCWKQLRERDAKLATEREDNLLRENALLERDLRATDNALRRACNERDYMVQEKEEERARRLRAEESLHRWKELVKEYFPGDQQQQHPGQQQRQSQPQPQQGPSLEAQFELYEKKWEVIRSGIDIDGSEVRLISFSQMPWPVVNMTLTDPSQIRPEHVQEFLTHPLREKRDVGGKGKSVAVKARDELMKWHSDKFNQIVISKVCEEDKLAVSEVVGVIVRVLTEMLK